MKWKNRDGKHERFIINIPKFKSKFEEKEEIICK